MWWDMKIFKTHSIFTAYEADLKHFTCHVYFTDSLIIHIITFTKITESTEILLSHYPLPRSATVQPKAPLFFFLNLGHIYYRTRSQDSLSSPWQKSRIHSKHWTSMYVGMWVTVCVRPLMYMTTDICVCKLYVCTVCVCLPLPNCKTGLGFIFVMWKQSSVLLKQTSAKNRPTHLALIKTAWLYSCSCSDLQASGKSREKENTDVCTLHRHIHTHTDTHLNKRSNSFINNCGKCVLWGEGAVDLTVATALMNNRQDNQ